ncbi:MAG: NUDIX domain-containing protein [Nanoarchaeota archaeon]
MKTEKSCGAIILHDGKFLLIKHHIGHWDFPKGHVESGETEEETALREVHEETGLRVEIIPGFKDSLSYLSAPGVKKTVIFFLARTDEEHVVLDAKEIADFAFLSYDHAIKQLTYKNSKELLKRAHEFLMKQHIGQ